MKRCLVALLFWAFVFVPVAFAVHPDELLKDPSLENRARALSAGLRCLVCQNQSIDDSDAPLARDLRVLVRERLKAGDSDEDILKFVVARYGDFILLKPPLNMSTLLLWSLPGAILVIAGGVILVNTRRRRRRETTAANLSDEESARLRDILDQKSP